MKQVKSDLVVVGAIIGAHGVRGDVRVKSFTAVPDDLFDYGPLLAEDGTALLDPKKVRPAKAHFIVIPAAPKQKEAWDALKGSRLYIPRDRLPETAEGEYYIEDLVGLDVFAGGDVPIGRVKAVLNHGAGDLIEVQRQSGGKPVLVPFTLADVPTVDINRGRLVISTFEIWADESRPDDAP